MSLAVKEDFDSKTDQKALANFELTEDDWYFVETISSRFHDETLNINKISILFFCAARISTLFLALVMFQHEKRQGLLQRGYNNIESVYQHARNMARIAGKNFQAKRLLKS